MTITATRKVTTNGEELTGGTTFNPVVLTEIGVDDSFQVEGDGNGALANVPPGQYDVQFGVTFYANGKTGLVKAQVVVDGENIVKGLSGYIEGNGSYNSSGAGRIKVKPGQVVKLEANAAAPGTMVGWASDEAENVFGWITLKKVA